MARRDDLIEARTPQRTLAASAKRKSRSRPAATPSGLRRKPQMCAFTSAMETCGVVSVEEDFKRAIRTIPAGTIIDVAPVCWEFQEYERQRMAGYAERDRQREKALAVSPFNSPRFNRYARLKEREVYVCCYLQSPYPPKWRGYY